MAKKVEAVQFLQKKYNISTVEATDIVDSYGDNYEDAFNWTPESIIRKNKISVNTQDLEEVYEFLNSLTTGGIVDPISAKDLIVHIRPAFEKGEFIVDALGFNGLGHLVSKHIPFKATYCLFTNKGAFVVIFLTQSPFGLDFDFARYTDYVFNFDGDYTEVMTRGALGEHFSITFTFRKVNEKKIYHPTLSLELDETGRTKIDQLYLLIKSYSSEDTVVIQEEERPEPLYDADEIVNRILKFKKLYDDGVIDEEEFKLAKRKLLR